MKKIFVALAAVATMVACSKDEMVQQYQEAIGFGNAFVGNSTRADAAADPSYSASVKPLTQFNVWGAINDKEDGFLPVFAGESVSGTVGANSVWNCTKTQYWVEDAVYNFAGLVNAGTVTLGNDKLPATVDFEVSTGKGTVDLLYALSDTYTGEASNNPLVKMDFNHLLSKVMFTVNNTSTAATEYSFLVKNITINGATAGTCALPAMTWTPTTSGNFTEFSQIPVAGGVAKQVCASELLLIPGEVNVSFTIDIIYGSKTIASHNYATTAAQTLKVGHAYNFVINVSVGQPIQFTVASYPTWENGNTTPTDAPDHIVLPVAEVTTGA